MPPGLSLKIVKDHGGDIRVQSKIGSGMTFEIYLPVIDSQEKIHDHAETADLPATGNERILLVDDAVHGVSSSRTIIG